MNKEKTNMNGHLLRAFVDFFNTYFFKGQMNRKKEHVGN